MADVSSQSIEPESGGADVGAGALARKRRAWRGLAVAVVAAAVVVLVSWYRIANGKVEDSTASGGNFIQVTLTNQTSQPVDVAFPLDYLNGTLVASADSGTFILAPGESRALSNGDGAAGGSAVDPFPNMGVDSPMAIGVKAAGAPAQATMNFANPTIGELKAINRVDAFGVRVPDGTIGEGQFFELALSAQDMMRCQRNDDLDYEQVACQIVPRAG